MGKKKRSGRAPTVGDKPFLHVQLRVFAHATEDLETVRHALARAAGLDLEDEDDQKRFDKATTDTQTEGYYHNPIHILECELTRNADVKRFWATLFAENGLAKRLAREVDQRLDDDLVFWMRLDKQAAARDRLRLTTRDDAIQVRAKLATYPKDRGVGMGFLTGFLEDAAQA